MSALVLVGCGPTLGTRGILMQNARGALNCGFLDRVIQLTDDAFEVDGCGRMIEYTDVAPGPARLFGPMPPAVRLASTDMQCQLDQLTTVGVREPTRRTFSGCGATASYLLDCTREVGCYWRRDGEVIRALQIPVEVPLSDVVVPPPPGAP